MQEIYCISLPVECSCTCLFYILYIYATIKYYLHVEKLLMTSKFILNKTFISAARIQKQNAGNSEGIATTTTSLQKGTNIRRK